MPQIYAGTSGFAYASWKPDFYPADLPLKKLLAYYALRLNSTEINYTFRRLPAKDSLAAWVDATPPAFLFSLKAHMKLTHVLRLKNCASFIEIFLQAIDPLRVVKRLGPVLFQTPPNLKPDIGVLRDFLTLLPDDMRFAFEFRNPGWLTDATYEALAERKVCLCLAESDTLVIPQVITAPFVYFRLRKPEYTAQERAEIADRVNGLADSGRDIFVYFKHETSPAGALYAEDLLKAASTDTAATVEPGQSVPGAA